MTESLERNRALGLLIYSMPAGTTITRLADGRWKCRTFNPASVTPGRLPNTVEPVPGQRIDFEHPPRATAVEALMALGYPELDAISASSQDVYLWISAGGLLAELPAGWSFARLVSGNFRCGNMPIEGGPMPRPMVTETGPDAMSTLNLALDRTPA